jgi:hypothetical protein
MPLVDVHNHILSREYADLLARFGGHRYSLARDAERRTVVMRAGARWPGRFRGLGSVPLQDIGDIAGCVRRIATLPIGEAEKELISSRNTRRLFKL